jgi:tetratricopeptide (TPR) repeat protein
MEQALEMTRWLYPEEQYPNGHPDLAHSLYNLGFLLKSQDEYGEARKYLEEGLFMYQDLAELFFATASEVEALNFAADQPATLDALLSVWRQLDEPAGELYRFVWRSRGAIQHVMAWRQQMLAAVGTPAVRERYQRYLEKRRALSRLTLAPADPDPKRTAARRKRLAELTRDKERLERELAEALPQFGDHSQRGEARISR